MKGRRTHESPTRGPVVETEFRVRYAETDAMGIAHHSNYFVWFEAGRTEYTRVAELPYRDIEETGVRLVVVEAFAQFHRAARYDDVLIVRTTLREVTRATLSATRSGSNLRALCSSTAIQSMLRRICTGACNECPTTSALRFSVGEEPLQARRT